jgi:glycosyltransferase involved in cell wall biosynthesis
MPKGKSMKRVLMISYPFLPSLTAGAIRTERFARYLRNHSWISDVVTIDTRQDLYNDMSKLDALGSDISIHRTRNLDPWLKLKGMSPRIFPLRAARSLLMKFFSFPDHMLWWVPLAVLRSREVMLEKPIDAIYTTSPPHSTHLAGWWLSKLTGVRWVADFRDPWTQNRYHNLLRGDSVLDTFLHKIETALENLVLRQASIVLTNTPSNRQQLLTNRPWLAPEKVVYMPNGWEPYTREIPLPAGDRPFTIVHAGTFYPGFKPYALLHAIALWRDVSRSPYGEFPGHRLAVEILGDSSAATHNVISELQIEDMVTVHPWMAIDEARKRMLAADLLWATLGTGPASRSFVPSKLFEYIAADRPIIGFFPEGDAADLIRSTGTGVVLTSDHSDPVIRILSEALNGRRESVSWYKPRREVIDQYQIDALAERLAKLLHHGQSTT